MARFADMLANHRLSLIMSLPANDPALFRAAFEEGADVVKVHINLEHRASGTHFGSLDQERDVLEEMLALARGPVGLVPGAAVETAARDLPLAAEMGFDFFSIYAHHMPVGVAAPDREWMIACDGTYSLDEVKAMEAIGANVVEASIVPGTGYGCPLCARDLLRYHALTSATKLPVVVPTQRFIRPQEVQALAQTGVKGLMIGSVVTGRTEESIRQAVNAFRNAIDRM